MPRLPPVAASASAAPGSVAVPGALLLGNISPASLATPQTLDVLASAIKSSLVSSVPAARSATVIITSIVDVASGVALFGSSAGGSSRRRRLAGGGGASGSQGITVNFQVLLPVNAASSAASIAAAVAAPQASASASAAQAAFGASVLQNLIVAASASGNAALATAVSGATVAAAQPASSAVAPSTPAASADAKLSGGAIAGIVIGVLALFALTAMVALMRTGWAGCAPTKAAGDQTSAVAVARVGVNPLSAGVNPLFSGPGDAAPQRRTTRSPESFAPTAATKRLP